MIGRPLKWQTVEEIKPLIDAYFLDTPKEEWTITGLALALDTSRSTLIDYCNRAEDPKDLKVDAAFSDTIKKAKDKVENSYEVDLKKSGRTGTIFALKNFDWKDKTEQDLNVKDSPTPIINVFSNNSNKQDSSPQEKN